MTGSQNKEINGRKLNNVRPTESDTEGLSINDNIEDRYKVNAKGLRTSDSLKIQKRWPLSRICICDSQL